MDFSENMSDEISKWKAVQIATGLSVPGPDEIRVTDEMPQGIYVFWNRREPVWYVYPPPSGLRIGGDRVIVVSKKTGKVYFDGIVGE